MKQLIQEPNCPFSIMLQITLICAVSQDHDLSLVLLRAAMAAERMRKNADH
jgi:hypothetical protein